MATAKQRLGIDEVAYWADQAREATKRRDQWIVVMYLRGKHSLRAIAEAAKMTAPGVRRIIQKAKGGQK